MGSITKSINNINKVPKIIICIILLFLIKIEAIFAQITVNITQFKPIKNGTPKSLNPKLFP